MVFVREIFSPTHTLVGPVIPSTTGNGFIVTVVVFSVVQPFKVTEYVINEVPAAFPYTSPVTGSIVAYLVESLFQVPLFAEFFHKEVLLTHIEVEPVISGTIGEFTTVTVAFCVVVQPLEVTAYFISVFPPFIPVTIPITEIVAVST